MKIVLIGAMLVITSGCVSHSVEKVSGLVPGEEICVVRNPEVSLDFFNAYSKTLENVGYTTREVKTAGECPIYTTYTAQFGIHWGLYLARANLNVFKGGVSIGSATYKAPKADMSKHGRVQGKIQNLVNKMLVTKS